MCRSHSSLSHFGLTPTLCPTVSPGAPGSPPLARAQPPGAGCREPTVTSVPRAPRPRAFLPCPASADHASVATCPTQGSQGAPLALPRARETGQDPSPLSLPPLSTAVPSGRFPVSTGPSTNRRDPRFCAFASCPSAPDVNAMRTGCPVSRRHCPDTWLSPACVVGKNPLMAAPPGPGRGPGAQGAGFSCSRSQLGARRKLGSRARLCHQCGDLGHVSCSLGTGSEPREPADDPP